MADAVLEARDIEKSFKSGERLIKVLQGANFAIHPGESVSIRGESGSGKTTLLNVISGLERPDSGTVSWSGKDIAKLGQGTVAAMRARHTGMVFQAFYLVPELNALENVLLPARIAGRIDSKTRARARELLERVGMGERIHGSPTVFSGGERQRVAVARALINHPRVLLADEPTGNLDERTAESVLQTLLDVTTQEGAALILVTHNPDFAQRTQRALRMHNGVLSEVNNAESR